MIKKETFCNALKLIQEQDEINRQFSKALDLVGNGHYVFGAPNLYLDALLLVLKEVLNDKYEYIEWWLYESTRGKIVLSADRSVQWDLSTSESLLDYIVDCCNQQKK